MLPRAYGDFTKPMSVHAYPYGHIVPSVRLLSAFHETEVILRRIDLHDPLPDDLTFARSLNFTPTFVLMIDGQEVNRIEGYPGEDFFWGLLGQMLTAAGVEVAG